ncbi:MAG TPA: ABC transporter substrate-binding protein [Methanospirillum sp.]|nr:ABC transporter substrate-binding protein [Methanospirillum sp.]
MVFRTIGIIGLIIISISTFITAAYAEGAPLKLGYLSNACNSDTFIGNDLGIYEKNGLKVELVPFTNSGEVHTALVAGKIDIAGAGASAPLTYIAKGADEVLIGGLGDVGGAALVVKKERAGEFSDLKALVGKQLGVVRAATGDVVYRGALTAAGIDWKKDLTIVELESPNAVNEAVKSGKIDAGVTWTPFSFLADEQGLAVVSWSDQYFPSHPCCRVSVLRTTLDTRHDDLITYLKSNIEASKVFNTDHPGTLNVLANYIKIDPAVLEESTYSKEHFGITPDPDTKGVKKFWNDMQDIGYIDTSSINLDDHIDVSLYKEALSELVKENPDDAYYKGLEEDYTKKNL